MKPFEEWFEEGYGDILRQEKPSKHVLEAFVKFARHEYGDQCEMERRIAEHALIRCEINGAPVYESKDEEITFWKDGIEVNRRAMEHMNTRLLFDFFNQCKSVDKILMPKRLADELVALLTPKQQCTNSSL